MANALEWRLLSRLVRDPGHFFRQIVSLEGWSSRFPGCRTSVNWHNEPGNPPGLFTAQEQNG